MGFPLETKEKLTKCFLHCTKVDKVKMNLNWGMFDACHCTTLRLIMLSLWSVLPNSCQTLEKDIGT